MDPKDRNGVGPVLDRLRSATGAAHRRLEGRFNAVAELSDPFLGPVTMSPYTMLFGSALPALDSELEGIEGLDFWRRRHAWSRFNERAGVTPDFPHLEGRSEALGGLYVIKGSTLGARLILRQLSTGGIVDPELSLLNPYGRTSARMWRSLMAVLEREGAYGSAALESMCRSATRAFAHAERVLCGEFA